LLQGTKSRFARSFSRTAKAEKGTAAMFGLLDLMTKRVNDQIVEYAAAQSEIARRLWGIWLEPFQTRQPVKISVSRRSDSDMPARAQRPFRF
jgi:hypothetical protein